jgi:hypothetical protein
MAVGDGTAVEEATPENCIPVVWLGDNASETDLIKGFVL